MQENLYLQQLKQLVLDGGFDEESRNAVAELEQKLHRLAVAENLKTHPPIKEWLDYLEAQISHCNTLLRNDRSLTDLQRQTLFEKREVCEKFVSMFNGSGKQAVEEEINNLLNVAKTQS